MFILRDYQKKASDAAVSFFESNYKKNAMLVLPTGSGKSLIIADIANRLDAPTLIFQPSREILEQNFKKLCNYDVFDCSVYSASFNSKNISRITFATIGSVINKPELFKVFKYIIIDECHLVNPKQGMYRTFLDILECKILGLTATPYRLATNSSGSMLRFLTRTIPRVFNKLLFQMPIPDLVRRGYLAKLDYFSINLIKTDNLELNSTGADFSDKSVLKEYQNSDFQGGLRNVIERLSKVNRRGILIFTRFVREAQYVADQFADCEVISGKTKPNDRKRILTDFKSGEIKMLANVGVLTAGFDYPELDTVVIARPTMSLILYYQMIGRCMRPHPDKAKGWVIDLGDNIKRFGKVEDMTIEEPKKNLYHVESNGKQLTNVYYNE